MPQTRYHILFSDIGGVLGSNGWDTRMRRQIAEQYNLNFEALERRHNLMFDSFERGFMRFDEYLRQVFFETPRPFTLADIREFAFNQSTLWPENLALLRTVKVKNHLKVGLISNEGEGLTDYRVRSWRLREVADFLVFSCCVHMRKPDPAIWQLGLDLAQAQAAESIYIDDRPMFVDIASNLGFTALHHTSVENTAEQLRTLGLIVS